MNLVIYVFAGLMVIGWIALILWLAGVAFETASTGKAWLCGVLAALVLVLPFAMIAADQEADPYANVLCVDGYQEWHTTRTSPVLVGKVIVPGHDVSSKVWVCRQWGGTPR